MSASDGDHVDECGDGFVPATSLETTVGVGPESFDRDDLGHGSEAGEELGGGGDAGRVNIVETGSDGQGVADGSEGREEVEIAARALDGEDISVEVSNVLENVLELGVAHVGVDLAGRLDPSSREAEAFDDRAEVVGAGGEIEGETLTEAGLVHLDNLDAALLQSNNLVANGEGYLNVGGMVGLVVADEGPLKNSGRSGEHALHGFGGKRLSVDSEIDGHVLGLGLSSGGRGLQGAEGSVHSGAKLVGGTAHISEEDARLDATGSVGLDPSIVGGEVALELLSEELDHIRALKFSMNQDVQTDLLLLGNAGTGLFLDVGLIFQLSLTSSAIAGALGANLGGLREGTDGGRGDWRELQDALLSDDTLGVGLRTEESGDSVGVEVLDASLDGCVGYGCALATGLQGGGVLGQGLFSNGNLSGINGDLSRGTGLGKCSQSDDRGNLLQTESQPGQDLIADWILNLGSVLVLVIEAIGDMEERAR